MRAKSIAPLRKCGPGTSTMQGQTATRYGVETSCRRAAIAPMMPANQSGAERLRERIVAEREQGRLRLLAGLND